MDTWKHLIKAATLGLNRVPFHKEGKEPWLEGLGETADTSINLLELTAAYALARRVGWTPETVEGCIPSPAPAETGIYLSTQAANLVHQTMSTNSGRLITEALQLCVENDYLVPPEYLPVLFRQAMQIDIPADVLLKAAGNRGPWLAAQHESWRSLLPLTGEVWETGTVDQRLKWFLHLRKHKLAESRMRFEELKATEASTALVKFLPLMEEGLGPEDEALLAPLLSHRRKEVRLIVSGLLGQIAESEYVGRMQTRLEELIQLKGRKLIVELPLMDDGMKQDQVHERSFAASGLGKKAGYLCAMLSSLPSTFWCQKWDKTPKQLLALAGQSEWKDALILGWTLSAITYRDEDWILAILQQILDTPPLLDVIKDKELSQMADLLPAERQAVFFLKKIREVYKSNQHLSLFKMMLLSEFMLSEQLAVSFIQLLTHTLQQRDKSTNYHFRSLLYADLPMLALRVPVESYGAIAKLLNADVLGERWYQAPIDELLEILALRYRLRIIN